MSKSAKISNLWAINIIVSLSLSSQSYAESQYFTMNGKIRAYNFNRIYQNSSQPNQAAFGLSGQFNFVAKLGQSDFSVIGSLFSSQSLGLNSSNPRKIDNTLPGYTINSIAQSYLQYQTLKYLARLGNQRIETPWLSSSDSRLLPAAYQGFYGTVNLDKNFAISGLRITRFKSRTADTFTRTNLYNTENYGGNGIAQYGDEHNNGASALGLDYVLQGVRLKTWVYQFNHLANLAYADIKYLKESDLKPFMAIQLFHQWRDGKNKFQPFTEGSIKANGFGLQTGLEMKKANIALGYNSIFKNVKGFKQGDLISPYTAGYASDPLYTTSMMGGLVEKGAGYALKCMLGYKAYQDKLSFNTSFAKYYTEPFYNNTHEFDLSVGYLFSETLEGLKATYRTGALYGNLSTGYSISSRIMLEYEF